MWYVNVSQHTITLNEIEFYINYVICKFIKHMIKVALKASFILTMWYVNYSTTGSNGGYGLSFILTMWYVNLF